MLVYATCGSERIGCSPFCLAHAFFLSSVEVRMSGNLLPPPSPPPPSPLTPPPSPPPPSSPPPSVPSPSPPPPSTPPPSPQPFQDTNSNESYPEKATVRRLVFATAPRKGCSVAFETQRGAMESHILVRNGPDRSFVSHNLVPDRRADVRQPCRLQKSHIKLPVAHRTGSIHPRIAAHQSSSRQIFPTQCPNPTAVGRIGVFFMSPERTP